jgi:hypothetical protein
MAELPPARGPDELSAADGQQGSHEYEQQCEHVDRVPGYGRGQTCHTRRVAKRTQDDPIARLRALCLALPEVVERPSHGEVAFFVRGKKMFAMVDDHHHGASHLGFWCPAAPGVQQELIAEDPARFYRPPYVGPSGWIGVRLRADGLPPVEWAEVDEIVRDGYRKVAPKTLARLLDE